MNVWCLAQCNQGMAIERPSTKCSPTNSESSVFVDVNSNCAVFSSVLPSHCLQFQHLPRTTLLGLCLRRPLTMTMQSPPSVITEHCTNSTNSKNPVSWETWKVTVQPLPSVTNKWPFQDPPSKHNSTNPRTRFCH